MVRQKYGSLNSHPKWNDMGLDTNDDKVRIDKWLWAARFFKTRSIATKAVNGGHVHVNGARVKPARVIQVGDTLAIRRGHVEFEVVVLGLSERRGPAVKARTLYEETGESIERREQNARERRLLKPLDTPPERKPDKKDRRKIRKFLRRD
jgi:ribosome-associated heat shock protein Hsp15